MSALTLRELRGKPEDLAAVPGRLAEARALAVARLGDGDEIVRRLDYAAADWAYASGDLARAHALYDHLRRPLRNDHARRITGRVVDASGAPVAGATVVAGPAFRGDAVAVAIYDASAGAHLRETTTAADGTFALDGVAGEGIVVAQHGTERSAPAAIANDVTLAVAPTSRLVGHVDLRGEPPTSITVVAFDKARPFELLYDLVSPVQRDGSFELGGVPRGRVVVRTRLGHATSAVLAGVEVDVRGPDVTGLALALGASSASSRSSCAAWWRQPVPNAQVIVLPGRVPSTNALVINRNIQSAIVRFARQIDGEHAPAPVLAHAKPGDMYATMTDVPDGPVPRARLACPRFVRPRPAAPRAAAPRQDRRAVRAGRGARRCRRRRGPAVPAARLSRRVRQPTVYSQHQRHAADQHLSLGPPAAIRR